MLVSDAPYYVPNGTGAANFDYPDAEGNWLSIAESPSQHATVQEWLDDVGCDTDGECCAGSGCVLQGCWQRWQSA
jgi:hypothetical protein